MERSANGLETTMELPLIFVFNVGALVLTHIDSHSLYLNEIAFYIYLAYVINFVRSFYQIKVLLIYRF